MRTDRTPTNFTLRQKIIAAALAVVLAVVIWQFYSFFRGTSSTTASKTVRAVTTPQLRPVPAPLPPVPQVLSPQEVELMRLQQETEAKYLAALNELQMLRISRDMAETNQAIAAAQLASVTAQKGIVDLLSPPVVPPGAYASGLVSPVASGQTVTTTVTTQEINYTVISVSQLQSRWSAVLGFQGKLYNVFIGDVLPPDGSKVAAIDRGGVVLEKAGVRKRVSLVPII